MADNNNVTQVVPPEHDVSIATTADLDAVSTILASGFRDDPVLNWLCNAPDIYPGFFRYEADALYMRHGHVFINKAYTGAAMWLPPGVAAKRHMHWRYLSAAWDVVIRGGLKSVLRSEQLDRFFADNHIKEPHYYLRSIGVSH
jgi:hypothetical protein